MSDSNAGVASELFLREFPSLDERGRRQFTEAVQDLFLHCYVIRGGLIRANPRYTFLERHEDLVNAYVALGGWRLHVDAENGVARLYHPEGSGRIHFNKEETTIVLVLRLLHHEQRKVLSESADTILRVGAIRERLHALLPPATVKQFLSRKSMGRVLRRLEHLRILRFETNAFHLSDETQIVLLPSLEHLVSQQAVETTQARLQALFASARGAESPIGTDKNDVPGEELEDDETTD